MESQLEHLADIMKCTDMIRRELPDTMVARDAFKDEVYKDGALSHKVKRLIAMAVALHAACPGCIIYQTKVAVEAGATKGEVLEAVSVAMAIGGTTTGAWSWRVVRVLEELGKG